MMTQVYLYPNPTTRNLNIETKESYQNLDVTIYNLLGEKLHSVRERRTIDISHMGRGHYIVKVELDDSVIVKRIIKEEE